MSNVIIYTTPTCSRCRVLKKKMRDKNIEFTESQDMDKIMEMGYLAVPILEVDDKCLEMKNALSWIDSK